MHKSIRVKTRDKPFPGCGIRDARPGFLDDAPADAIEVARFRGPGYSASHDKDDLVVHHGRADMSEGTNYAGPRSAAARTGDQLRRRFNAEIAQNRSIAANNRAFWAMRGGR